MSKLEELIARLCPDGVEYKELKFISKMRRGTSLVKKNASYGEYPVISGGKEPAFYCDSYNRTGETITVAGSGAGAGYIQYWTIPIFVNDAFSIQAEDNTLTKYLYYCLANMQQKIYDTKKGGGVPHVHISSIENFKLPVPPLEVQREIVHILDSYTASNKELKEQLDKELAARQKQYEFYRGSFFPSLKDSNLKWISLGEVAKVTKLAGYEFTKYVEYSNVGEIIALRGLNVKKGHLVLNDVKFIDNSNLQMLSRSKLYVDDMLFTYVGTIGEVALIDKNDKYYLAPNVSLIRLNRENYLPKYVMYYFLSQIFEQEQVLKLLQASSMKNIPMEKIRLFKLPVVPLSEQQRIVDILDRFDALCNDITSGLPAEIEARKKQYEYYRDKLLTFKELKKEA